MPEEIKENVDNLLKIYLPKLEHISNTGGASTIHEANRLISLINGWYQIALKDKELGNNRYLSSIVTCREYIRTAELWLIEIAKD
jgi:hypothetical protein